MQQEDNDLLTNFEYNLVRASAGKRLLNYLTDIVVITFLIVFVMLLLSIVNPAILTPEQSPDLDLAQTLLNVSIYIGYMFLTETFFNGKSLGKLITGTRAINLDGSKISGTTAMKRALVRIIPFSSLSALGVPCSPWWDKWTNTMVIDEKLSSFTPL